MCDNAPPTGQATPTSAGQGPPGTGATAATLTNTSTTISTMATVGSPGPYHGAPQTLSVSSSMAAVSAALTSTMANMQAGIDVSASGGGAPSTLRVMGTATANPGVGQPMAAAEMDSSAVSGLMGMVASPAPPHTPTSMCQHTLSAPTPQTMPQHPGVPQSPIPQVQVIQQPLQNQAYLQQLYSAQQQLLMPGNITVQSLQSAGMSPSIQVITGKHCVPNQLTSQMLGKQVLQGQSNYIPTSTNQTLVFGQLGVLSSQPSIISAHNKPIMAQAAMLQPKLPHQQGNAATTVSGATGPQLLNSAQFKHLTSQAIMSAPQLITTNASGAAAMLASQSQIISPLQAIGASLPPGITWAASAPGNLQSPTLLTQNPIFIRSGQQQDMFIQSPPPQQQPQPTTHSHTPIQPAPAPNTATLAAHIQPTPKAKQRVLPQGMEGPPIIQPKGPLTAVKTIPSIFPSTHIPTPIRPASSVATQTNNSSNAMALNTSHFYIRPQHKHRNKTQNVRGIGNLDSIRQKADAANQTQVTGSIHSSHIHRNAMEKTFKGPQVGMPVMSESPTTISTTTQSTQVLTIREEPMDTSSNINGFSKSKDFGATQMKQLEPVKCDNNENSRIGKVFMTIPSSKNEVGTSINQLVPVQNNFSGAATAIIPAVMVLPANQSVNRTSSVGTNVDSSASVVTAPLNKQVMCPTPKDKQPQKAIVKPQVLTHVIEGFIIQEGSEPFPVTRTSAISEFNNIKSQEKFDVATLPSAPVATLAVSPATSILTSHEDVELSESSKHIKKKKHNLKPRKGIRKSHNGKLAYNPDEWVSNDSPTKDDSNDSQSGGDSSLSPTTPQSQKDIMEVDQHETEPKILKDPRKWAVLDVYEFIKSLPGCCDYADEFRLQEIDGQALMLLKEDHLMSAMGMKLGPALKICARINTLKDEHK